MSSMLEQAIVDAEQLKETARQTAEETVVEKYQDEIREAVEKILEQEEDIFDDAGTLDETEEEDPNLDFVDDLPATQTADDEAVVTIDLDKLEEMMAEEMEDGGLDASEMVDREDIAEEIAESTEDDDEMVELDEENLADVLAELMSEASDEEDTDVVEETTEEDGDVVEEAVEEDDDVVAEETKKLQKESKRTERKNKSLLNERKQLNGKVRLLEKKMDKYGTVITKLKEKLEESSLINSKLLYQNRILNSVSLNERQKNKIVETISNATTVEEAKIIFETLQSAVGSIKKQKLPESLNEVVTRSSSAFFPRREETVKVDSFAERMKILAGLDKK